MSNDLPSVTECADTACEETDPTGKSYAVVEAIPVCASTSPASSLGSSDCTKLDNTYDIALQSVVVPAVGGSMQISVCNASLYTVGSWIEFVDGSGAGSKYQIIAVNSTENYISVRNSCSDGVTAISGNAPPGSTFVINSRFIVIGEPICQTSDEKVEELQETINAADELCLEGITDRLAGVEETEMLGVVAASDCEEGEAQPCLRKLLTREAKDGSLILGNIDVNLIGGDEYPVFFNSSNKLVKGEIEEDIFKWLLSTVLVINNHTSDPGSEQTYTPPNVPSGATHAIVQVHVWTDDNPAGNIAVKFGNIVPIRTQPSAGESMTVMDIAVPIVDGDIKYSLYATTGGSMDFTGSTFVELDLIGFEKITTI